MQLLRSSAPKARREEPIGPRPATSRERYAPIRDYAAIGDGATVGLVARDGSIDWLPLPTLSDSPPFAAILDAERGGRFVLGPDEEFTSERRYLPDTNVLETVFHTRSGSVRVTDALTMPETMAFPSTELARRIEGIRGSVPLRWRVEPRRDFGRAPLRFALRRGVPIAGAEQMVAVFAWEAGEPHVSEEAVAGRFQATAGSRSLLALTSARSAPLPFVDRDEVERRLDSTASRWRQLADIVRYDGPWRDAVVRSALALELLVQPSGAIAAAPTTSLPERIGGPKNWDYRFCWIRDTAFTLDAFIHLGFREQVQSSFTWLTQVTRKTAPRLQVLYGLLGDVPSGEHLLRLDGYRSSRPVRVGNAASDQLQLDAYGDFFETTCLYVRDGSTLDRETRAQVAATADVVCEIWREPDSGMWELRGPALHYTLSKMGCWQALTRALELAELGELPREHTRRWRREAEAIRAFVERECWSERRQSYVFYAGADALDAGVLRAVPWGYFDHAPARLASTVDAIRGELGDGPLVYRYSGMQEEEGAFLACSFWLVSALTRLGQLDEADELMAALVALANDVGLYAEEMDPGSKEMLGNFPQALTHLALINAAHELEEARLGA